ncbi:MAG: hypothetical protein JNK04_25415 [Myxococcales bacterium]|nr:hypothetical protein [Myxococcales bacterium]
MKRTLCIVALLTAACHGRIGDTEGTGDNDGVVDPNELEPAFALPDQQPQLLPFWVRLERVSSVVGVPSSDPMFSLLLENRLGLGDYDYASGVKPDRLWSPGRMSLWAKSLQPVCASEAMHTAYPKLTEPSDAVAMASAAWGRKVDASELGLDAASLAALEEGPRYEAVCLAILSSAELVIQ